ncbi:unnamed protein product [Ophioblennius macclurei]
MDVVTLCEPTELYNLLNQRRGGVSRLAELNHLYLIDARERLDYDTSHIWTAKIAKTDSDGIFVLPEWVEVDSFQHVVVYDHDTSSLKDPSRALDCAQLLAKVSFYPVHVVRGGFKKFTALYTFLRTEKILYTITELENLRIYPVEIIPGLLYMGDLGQASDDVVLKDLKIKAMVNLSESEIPEFSDEENAVLNVSVEDSVTSDLYSSFKTICCFIESSFEQGSRVLIVSRLGRSRCSAATIAFMIHHFKHTLEEAWQHVLKCKPSMRPNSGFLQQLSEWELHTKGIKLTDISHPHF